MNPDVANKLASFGFSYMKEQINNNDVYVFTHSQDLMKCLQNDFSKCEFFFEKKLRF